jgi:hypothetical protein
MGSHASTGVSLQEGPLIEVYEQAKANGSFSVGSYQEFVKEAGVPLVGTDGRAVALVDEEQPTGLKVAAKLMRPVPGAPMPQFEGGEHTAIGDSILLRFSANDPGTPAYQVQLLIQTGLSLTYGQIVALAGDFYGIPDEPIADGATPADRRQRFQNCYNTLASGSVAECQEILTIMQREITEVNAALNQGLPASTVYDRLGNDLNKAWNKATGGGSLLSDFIPPGRYLNLSSTNWDHFGEWAVLAYQAGHAVALGQAITAHNIIDPTQARAALAKAYAMNAFADHFLSDLFSAGHIRNPRRQIYQSAWNAVTRISANLCVKGMHDEDCKYGLRVSNRIGDTWRAYGDKRYFATVDLQNKALVDTAVQASASEIFNAFINGTQPANPGQYIALQFVPNLAQVQDYQNNPLGNFVPLFVVDGETVKCRNDLDDLNTAGWTSVWTTGGVAYSLNNNYNPNNPTAYIAPPRDAPVIGANGWQSTVPIPPNWVNGNQVRYAVSFVSPDYESTTGPSCAYFTLNNAFQPTLTGLPLGPAGTVSRNVYREFLNKPFAYCGSVNDNTTTTFVDNTP